MPHCLRRRVLWLSVLLLTVCPPLQAQRLPIRVYTTADGLAHNSVRRIVRDSRGFLWFCTAEGLSRFDGYAFANFGAGEGLPHPSVTDLLETRDGGYWVATGAGLVRFDPKGRPGRGVVYQNDAGRPAPMFTVVVPDGQDRRSRAITVLHEGRDGTIWAGTNNGLYRLASVDGHLSLQPVDIGIPDDFPEQREVADVLEDRRGSLWVAAPSGLYRRWPDGRAVRYEDREAQPYLHLADLLEDRAGRLWAGSRARGFFQFTPDDTGRAPVIKLHFKEPDLPTSWVFQLFEASSDRFWVATNRGLLEFLPTPDEHGRRFRSYASRDGLSDYDITAVGDDVDGNLWLGTSNAGIMKLSSRGLSSYGAQDGIQQVNSIFHDRAGNICFRGIVQGDARTSVFEGGMVDVLRGRQVEYHPRLGCFDGLRFDWFWPAGVVSPGWVNEGVTLQTRDGEWWMGTSEGLYRFPASDHLAQSVQARPVAVYTAKDGIAGVQIYRLFEDASGNVWISSLSENVTGLARWERRSGTIHDYAHAPDLAALTHDWPARAFAEDRAGNLWIGFDGEVVRFARGVFEVFTSRDGLPPGAIKDIHVDQSGRLWLASAQSGLVGVDDPAAARPAFVSYTKADGLSSENLEVITEDRDGHLYIGGGRGLDRFDPATRRVRQYGAADGLVPGTFRAAFRDRDGVLWFGTSAGLARLAPAAEQPPAAAPLVLITGLRTAGAPRLVSALGEQDLSLPDLAPDENQVQIDFVALGFGSGEVLRYQHRLDSTSTGWSAPDDQRTVTYAGLAPGRYRFEVRALNSDGDASADPATVRFRILAPLWQRWWFVSLVALALGFVLHQAYRYRLARAVEIADMRTRIATDLHDDIGANLTRIVLLSEVARQTHDGGPLVAVTRIARESVSSMSDIVWAINPYRESLLDLIRRMRQHAEEVFTLRDIELRFEAPDASEAVKLSVEVRRDLLLIFKEVVNNAARHSGCSRVAITVRVEGTRVLLTVSDNGVGFDTSREGEGQGLASIRRRAHRLGATLEMMAGAGAGTSVKLGIPI